MGPPITIGGMEAAEIVLEPPAGFNGAADNNRRNGNPAAIGKSPCCGASMGPPITIGGMRRRPLTLTRYKCFNGAADNNRRNELASGLANSIRCFNGAADNNGRNAQTSLAVVLKSRQRELQWGRR